MSTTNSEYKTVQTNFDRIAKAVGSSIEAVARKAFERNLISEENMISAINVHSEISSRSTYLLARIMNKVEENKEHFQTFISILRSILTLNDLADDLAKQCTDQSSIEGHIVDSRSALNNLKPTSFEEPQTVLLQSHPSRSKYSASASHSTVLTFQCRCGSKCSLETCLSCECRGQLDNVFPYLDMRNMSERDKDKLIRRLIIETNKIITVFEELVYDTFESLNAQEIPIDELRKVALTFGHQSLPRPYQEDHSEQLLNIRTVNDVHAFLIKHKYISFFNYRILQKIITRLGTDNDKKKLQDFLQQFREFCKRRVFEVPSSTIANSAPELETNLVVKVKETLWFGAKHRSQDSYFNVDDLYAVEDKIATEIGVDPENLLLKDVKEGCVELHFVVLSDVPPCILKLESLLMYGIVPIDLRKEVSIESALYKLLISDFRTIRCIEECTINHNYAHLSVQ